MRKKSDLPTKICRVCQRPFAWRKKWERNWSQVLYCSERCRRARNAIDGSADLSGVNRPQDPRR